LPASLVSKLVKPAHDPIVRDGASGHGDRLEAIELVTCRLALSQARTPERHWPAQRHVHGVNVAQPGAAVRHRADPIASPRLRAIDLSAKREGL